MARMKKLGLPDLAVKYRSLSNKIMEHEVNRYVQVFQALPPATSTPMPMPTPMPTSSNLEFSDTNPATDVDSEDDDSSPALSIHGPVDLPWEKDEDGFLQPL